MMKRNLKLVCLSLSLCTAAVLARAPLAQKATANTTAAATGTYNVAIVYVSYGKVGGHAIKEYVADNLGKLTELPGSPYISNVNRMAVNGTYLFGIYDNDTKPYLETYAIRPDGTLPG